MIKHYTYLWILTEVNLDFTEARDDGVAVASAGPYANHLHLAPDKHSSTSPFNFYRPDALTDAQPTVAKQ